MPEGQADTPPRPGVEVVRKLLVAAVAGLLVARPVVLGEDPGLLHPGEPGNLVLTLLWLLTAVGWAAWRLWSGRGGRLGGVVEAALLVVVALTFVSAEVAAHYRHPARLIAWETLGLFLTFFLVRQLAADSPEAWHGLLTAVLASAVALSAYAVYQVAVEFPALRERSPEELRDKITRDYPGGGAEWSDLARRLRDNQAWATYARPGSFAGYLVLLLPGLVAAAVLRWRQGGSRAPTVLVGGCVALAVAALGLARSPPAVAAGLLAGLVVAAVAARRRALRLALLIAVGVALAGVGYALWRGHAVAPRLEYWRTTWRMVADRPWLGVGPGNFGRSYPRFMPESATAVPGEPHDFALETWATAGVFTLLALLTALAAFFVRAVRFARAPAEGPAPPGDAPAEGPLAPPAPAVAWEFYAGGMFGLLLGFVLRVAWRPADDLTPEAIAAAMRSVVWFLAFALLERTPWTGRAGAVALAAGVLALLLTLCVCAGIGYPSVAGPLLAVMALALALMPWPGKAPSRLALAAPLPVAAVLILVYLSYVFTPVLTSTRKIHEASRLAVTLGLGQKAPPTRDPRAQAAAITRNAVEPLEQAAADDPDNAGVHTTLAYWYGQLWSLTSDAKMSQAAVDQATAAQKLDPDGLGGYEMEAFWREQLALRARRRAAATRKQPRPGAEDSARQLEAIGRMQFLNAAAALRLYLPHDPSNAIVRYRLAQFLIEGGKPDEARQNVQRALELDDVQREAGMDGHAARTLTDRQRTQLRRWLGRAEGG